MNETLLTDVGCFVMLVETEGVFGALHVCSEFIWPIGS